MNDTIFLTEAIRLSALAVEHGNEPFGAVLVRDGQIVATSENQIHTNSDPTHHAELALVQAYCRETGITDLSEYTLYSSCEPCFMCSGALVWMKLGTLVWSAGNTDLAGILGEPGCDCARLVFDQSAWRPEMRSGLLQENSVPILAAYFFDHAKG